MQDLFSFFWWIYFCVFFSGYPFIYILFYFIGKRRSMHHAVEEKILPILPLAYALVAICFWLLVITTGRMNFVIQRISSAAPSALVILYSLTSLLFFLPAFRRKIWWSLLHSLPLFVLPFYYIFSRGTRSQITDREDILNLIRIYAAGFMIYIIVMVLMLAIRRLLKSRNKLI
jgi:hypothetical protein